VGNATARIHEQHAGAQPVKRVGERCGLRRFELDQLSDQHGAAKVRNQEPQPLARRLVGETFALMAKQGEPGVAFGRSVEIDADVVDPALRPDPLLVKARMQKLGMRHDRRGAEDFTDVEHEIGAGHRVERQVFLDIELAVIGVGAELVDYAHAPSRGIMHEKAARRSADKGPDLGQNGVPGLRNQCGIVNPADQLKQGFVQVHAQAPPGASERSPNALGASPSAQKSGC
jgi:hypothetical protein